MTSPYTPSLTLQYALLPETAEPNPAPVPVHVPAMTANIDAADRGAWLTLLASYPTDLPLVAHCIRLISNLSPGPHLVHRVAYCVTFATQRRAATAFNIERIIMAAIDGWDLFVGDGDGDYAMVAASQ